MTIISTLIVFKIEQYFLLKSLKMSSSFSAYFGHIALDGMSINTLAVYCDVLHCIISELIIG